MEEHDYRGYVIKVEAVQTRSAEFWEGRAYIHFDEGSKSITVQRYGPFDTHRTKEEAEQHILEDSKKWVDERLASQR